MRFCDIFDSYTDDIFKSDVECRQAIDRFKSNIPGRVLQIDFDATCSNKQGIKQGDRVYKLGLDLASSTALIEYFENCNQGQPTMAIYINKNSRQITITGWQTDKKLCVVFAVSDGAVKKTVSIS